MAPGEDQQGVGVFGRDRADSQTMKINSQHWVNDPASLKYVRTERHQRAITEAMRRFHADHPGIFSGQNNPNWKGGCTPESRTRLGRAKYRRARAEALDRDGHACRECGASGVVLHAHHILPWREGGRDAVDNLITLCAKCHMRLEAKEYQERMQIAIEAKCDGCAKRDADTSECLDKFCPLYPFRGKTLQTQRGDK